MVLDVGAPEGVLRGGVGGFWLFGKVGDLSMGSLGRRRATVFCRCLGVVAVAVFGGVFADVAGDLHGAEGGAAHGTEVSGFGSFGW